MVCMMLLRLFAQGLSIGFSKGGELMSLYPLCFRVLIAIISLTSPLLEHQVNARWATFDNASLECLDGKAVFRVRKDGSAVVEVELQMNTLRGKPHDLRSDFFGQCVKDSVDKRYFSSVKKGFCQIKVFVDNNSCGDFCFRDFVKGCTQNSSAYRIKTI